MSTCVKLSAHCVHSSPRLKLVLVSGCWQVWPQPSSLSSGSMTTLYSRAEAVSRNTPTPAPHTTTRPCNKSSIANKMYLI